MIFDSISHLDRYGIPFTKEIISFLKKNRPETLEPGEIEIDGRSLFVRPARYETKPSSQGKFETHRVYMDLQYVVEGAELMQAAPADLLVPLTDYDEKGDYQFFRAIRGVSSFIVRADEFAVFWPGEAHCPSCSIGDKPEVVKKLVFKIRIA